MSILRRLLESTLASLLLPLTTITQSRAGITMSQLPLEPLAMYAPLRCQVYEVELGLNSHHM